MKSQTVSLKPTKSSASPSTKVVTDPPTGTAECTVIYAEFAVSPKPSAITGALDIDELVAELEQSPENAKAIAQGRQWVADAFYSGQPSVAALRLRKGWSQAELARRAETSQPYIARLERGQVDPQVSTVRKLARALGVSIAELVEAIAQ
jgi:DNA-binding XRE family transcriptional regulator